MVGKTIATIEYFEDTEMRITFTDGSKTVIRAKIQHWDEEYLDVVEIEAPLEPTLFPLDNLVKK